MSLIEITLVKKVRLKEPFKQLTDIDGIGTILALTIMLETGDIKRFSQVGDFSSYCRWSINALIHMGV
ncbi:MAG: transposase [Legionella longbeachae]|nr:transposase [Legionella longbeachae]